MTDTKIVLSFANASGGHVFVHNFRNELMKRLNYYDSDAIYLDNVASRNAPGVTIAPDRRPHMDQGGGSFPIGAQHDNWKAMWKSAMSTARAVVVILTPAYSQSPSCAAELQEIDLAIKQRSDLHLIVLDVGPGAQTNSIPVYLHPANQPRSHFLQLDRAGGGQMQQIFPNSFDLTDEGYALVMQELAKAGANAA